MEQTYQITVRKADLGFLLEALALRAVALKEEIIMQTLAVERKELQERAEKYAKELTVTATEEKVEQAPAKKRGRPRKDPAAPYGRKKDGTPKQRPGRKTA